MINNIHDDFKSTVSGLEIRLQVGHIATSPLQGCDSSDDIAAVLSNPGLLSFDHIPVRYNGNVVGVIKRDACKSSTGQVHDYMHRLDESVLISADVPLLDFIKIDSMERLVLRGAKIDGIVTRSDLLKLPVRLLAFSLVTHVEALMSKLIRDTDVDEQV